MRVVTFLLLGLALGDGAGEPVERMHAGLSVGVGSAYDAVGVRGEIGTNHVGLFVGTGLLTTGGTNSVPGGGSVCFGARWYSEVRRGWFASLNFTYTWSDWYTNPDLQGSNAPTNSDNLFTAGGVVGYRFMWSMLFLEAGAGALWYRHQSSATCGISCAPPYPTAGPVTHGLFPDLIVGAGFDL
jgi:hypothetical protein